MYRKTPVKRLFKYLPIPERLEYAVAIDNQIESGKTGYETPLVDLPPAELVEAKPTATEKLLEKTRKPRSDKGQSRKEEPEPPEPPEPSFGSVSGFYQGEEAPQETNAGGTEAPPPVDRSGRLVDPDTADEIRVYCTQFMINPDKKAAEFRADGAEGVAQMTNTEAGVMLGWLLDQVAAKGA
jgi:hypothetical protein